MEQQETQQKSQERIVRILSKDIEGRMKLYAGLTKIKGVSWTISNAVCNLLKIDKNKRIGELTDTEIAKITEFLKNPKAPGFIFNRRSDLETGEDKHLIGVDLELKQEFDIHRENGDPHPLIEKYGIDARPVPHEDLDKWRHNFTGVQYLHEPTNLLIYGAIDDLW